MRVRSGETTLNSKGSSDGRSMEDLRDELKRLILEHLESLKTETFGGLNAEQLQQQEEQLNRIREVAADFLAALKRDFSQPEKI